MCDMDITTLGSVWANQTHPRHWLDPSTTQTCRNFEDIRAWAEKHQIPENVPDDYLEVVPAEGVRVLEVEP